MEFLQAVLTILAGLAGFPAALAAVINILKRVGWLADGSAPIASMIGHLIAYVAVGVAVLTGYVDLIPGIDVQLGLLANILLAVFAFLSSLKFSRAFHENVLIGLPLVGFSHQQSKLGPWMAG